MSATCWLAGAAQALPPPEQVRFTSLDHSDNGVVMIDALLYRPVATTTGERPAIIALHGCGGLYSNARGREMELSRRHAAHAESLLAAGYVVLFPDSLGSRGLRELCTVRSGERTVNPSRRRLDALGALQWLAAQPGVARERIALVGWSHGGSTVLATINASHREVARFRGRSDAAPFFRAAVAFYPGCTPALRDAEWSPSVATRILIGGADDWTPAEPCAHLGARAREKNWPLHTIVYAGAYHGFDAPGGRLVHRKDIPSGMNPGQGVHVGPDPEARASAQWTLAEFLREQLER